MSTSSSSSSQPSAGTALDLVVEGGVATLTLNRPTAMNALDPAAVTALGDLFAGLRRNPDVRVLVMTGAGGHFCAGADVKAMQGDMRTPQERRTSMERSARICAELLAFDRPVIAAADGVAFGAGFSLLLLSDLVLVSTRVRLSMVFHRIGLVPDFGAFYTLPRVVGLQRAKELVFSAREVGADEALRLGIAMESHEPQALMPRAQAMARSLVGASPTALSVSKRALQASLGADLGTVLEMEASGQALAGSSDYLREAARRFSTREPAQFQWPSNG